MKPDKQNAVVPLLLILSFVKHYELFKEYVHSDLSSTPTLFSSGLPYSTLFPSSRSALPIGWPFSKSHGQQVVIPRHLV